MYEINTYSNSTYLFCLQLLSLCLQVLYGIPIQDKRRDPSYSYAVRSQISGCLLLQHNNNSTTPILQAPIGAMQLSVTPSDLSIPINTLSGKNTQNWSYLVSQSNILLTLPSPTTYNRKAINRLVIVQYTILSTCDLCSIVAMIVLLPRIHSIRINQDLCSKILYS